MGEISIEHEGQTYTAEYEVDGDDLVVYLPDGSTRQTQLNGLSPASAARLHLRALVAPPPNKQ